MSDNCQGVLIGDRVNFLRARDRRSARYYDHCNDAVTHRVVAGCVHEHVLSWRSCSGCAAKTQHQVDEKFGAKCVECRRLDGHECRVLVQVEPYTANCEDRA